MNMLLFVVPTSRNKDWARIGCISVGHRGLVLDIFASIFSICWVSKRIQDVITLRIWASKKISQWCIMLKEKNNYTIEEHQHIIQPDLNSTCPGHQIHFKYT